MRRRAMAMALTLALATVAVLAGSTFGHDVIPGTPRTAGAVASVVGVNGVSLDIAGIHVEGPAGVAPPGTVLTASIVPDPPGGVAADFITHRGSGIALSLGGLQPAVPMTVIMPVPGEPVAGTAGVLITRPFGASETFLVPGVYDKNTHTVTAQVSHLSDFWAGFFRFAELADQVNQFLSQTLGLTAARPNCTGKSTKDADGGTVSLGGDFSVKANPVAWPCVRVEGDTAVVTLTANTPLPWRVRAVPDARLEPQGTVAISKR